jgi:hypothetical protein
MKLSFVVAAILALFASGASVAAQAPPDASPTPTPTFNFDEVKEVVSELRGANGTTHYVTLSEDTEGVVRIRLSLFSVPAGSYVAVLFRRGDCSQTAANGPEDALGSFAFRLDEKGGLVLVFFNSRLIGITPGAPNSIYDADGTSLAVYSPGDSGAGPIACARLDLPVGAPATGNSETSFEGTSLFVPMMAAVFVGAGAVLLLYGRRRRAND